MHILVVGGSGRIGSLIIANALAQGYNVTTLARDASSIDPHPRLTVVEGTVANQQDVSQAFDSAPAGDPVQAVLISLGASRASDSPWAKSLAPPSFLHDSMRHVLHAMQRHRVKKVVVLSAFGSGASWAQFPWIFKLLFLSSNMKYELADHNAVEQELRRAGETWNLDWTIAKPTILKAGETALREFGELGKGIGVLSGSSRQAVAQWMLGSLTMPGRTRKVVCLAA
jgi:nucleoside-diphosphate-sugar epimerase